MRKGFFCLLPLHAIEHFLSVILTRQLRKLDPISRTLNYDAMCTWFGAPAVPLWTKVFGYLVHFQIVLEENTALDELNSNPADQESLFHDCLIYYHALYSIILK